jgi:uncharacterized protein YdeI (YjbR/CyaY-like superfamily)
MRSEKDECIRLRDEALLALLIYTSLRAQEACDAVEALDIPPDLAAALGSYPSAQTHFDAFPRSVKRSILEWIASAKTPATRAKWVEETARLAQENVRANQWRRPT